MTMLPRALLFCVLCAVIPARLVAQTRPATLSTVFEDVFGPNGLVVSSDDIQLDGTNHAAHFNSAFQSDFRLMNIALASQLTTIPVPSPASGFIYEFDPATGTFVRATRSFGPILADRAETIGRDRVAFSFNEQVFSFDRLDGVSLNSIPAVFRHDAYQSTAGRSDVISTINTVQASVRQFTGAVTYGLFERLDLSLAVPIVRTRLSLLSNATVQRVGTGTQLQVHYFRDETAPEGHGTAHQFFSEGSASGVGDLLVRAKGTLMRRGRRALAAGLDLRMPTGDEENLLGAGALGARPFVVFSGTFGVVAPHANLAYQWNGRSTLAGDVRSGEKGDLPDQFIYAIGTDLSVSPRLSLVLDLVGQRVIDSPRLSTFDFLATGPFGTAALQDLRFENASYWGSSGSVGMKVNVAPRVLLNFNLRFALDNSGLTDRISPLIGAEFAF
jgi:hypothetical protein